MKKVISIEIEEIEQLGSLPDIDTDWAGERRDEIKQYLETKYGRDYITAIGTYGTFKLKNTVKDIAREKGVESATMNYITNLFPEPGQQQPQYLWELFHQSVDYEVDKSKQLQQFIQKYHMVVKELPLMLNQPKNASIHAAGVVLVPKEHGTLYQQLPVKLHNNILVSEWEGTYIDEAGFVKFDILGVKQFDKFAGINQLIKQDTGRDIRYKDIDLEDEKVFDLFRKGYNEDIFQLGGMGLKGYCKLLQPSNIEDLIATVALYRPGPIESNAHLRYVKRKNGTEEPDSDPGCEEITKNTYGLIIYQEQTMQICQHVGGFSLVEADDIRKALGKMKFEVIQPYKSTFIERSTQKGYDEEAMLVLWHKMEAFAAYAFNRCISGDETFYRASHPKSGKSTFRPTIREMYRIKNDSKYAKETRHESLQDRYRSSYGHGFSLNEENRLVKNDIVDIRYVGEKEIYRMTLVTGETIDTTFNHKFPTSNGEKKLEDIDIESDLIFVNEGFKAYDTSKRVGDGVTNYPEVGQKGFQKKVFSNYNALEELLSQKTDYCELCGAKDVRIEMHHKDGDGTYNVKENVIYLCVSCHKKEEYKLGRKRMGQAGLQTRLEKIESIQFLKIGDVYDVEMKDPYHTFTTKNNIVTSNSHSAAYAITGYYSQWFKANYPLQFWTISLQLSESEKLQNKIAEIKNGSSIDISSVSVNYSDYIFKSDVKTNTIYWALPSVKWVGDKVVQTILEERQKNGLFFSLEEFYQRVSENKPNKRAMYHLIICGAFDKVENIKYIEQRYDIMEKFSQLIKEPAKEWEKYQEMKLWREYQWTLKEKELTGFGFFNFNELILGSESFTKLHLYKDNLEILMEDLEGRSSKSVLACGLVEDIVVRSSKKGDFVQLQLRDNTESLYITIWNETFKNYKEELLGSKNKIVIFSGGIEYDTYKHRNVVRSTVSSKLEVL